MATTKTTTTTTKKTAAPATTVKVAPKLDIIVKLYDVKAEELYLIGNLASLGSWDASKAKKMTKKGDVFTATIAVKIGELVEYKVACGACWCKVEKGMFGEELENHHVFVDKDAMKVEVGVSNFSAE